MRILSMLRDIACSGRPTGQTY